MSASGPSPAFCRLYLPSPPVSFDAPASKDGALAAFEAALDKTLARAIDIACLRLSVAGLDDEAARGLLKRIGNRVQPRGIALLVEDRVELVASTGIDGVHLSQLPPRLEAMRQQLGPDRILGVGCALSRHDAMIAGEAEADYVSFAGEPETLLDVAGWWAALMTVPCVAEGIADPDQAAALATAGAEFIMPAAELWTSPLPDAAFEAVAQAIHPQP